MRIFDICLDFTVKSQTVLKTFTSLNIIKTSSENAAVYGGILIKQWENPMKAKLSGEI